MIPRKCYVSNRLRWAKRQNLKPQNEKLYSLFLVYDPKQLLTEPMHFSFALLVYSQMYAMYAISLGKFWLPPSLTWDRGKLL